MTCKRICAGATALACLFVVRACDAAGMALGRDGSGSVRVHILGDDAP